MEHYDSTNEIQCPACKTTKYRNPQMKLMVNVCGHGICDSCVKLLFIKECGQCPECDLMVKRSKYRVQIFEDPMVEKEIDIRRKVMKIFTKLEEDFDDPEDYNLYLEEIEEIVYNCVNNIDRPSMEKKMETYERLNKDSIRRSYGRRSKQDEELDRIIEAEKIRNLDRTRTMKEEEKKTKLAKIKNHSSLIEDLMASEGDANLIVQSHAERLRLETEKEREMELVKSVELKHSNSSLFSSGLHHGFAALSTQVDVANIQNGVKFEYVAPELPLCLPAPSVTELESGGYLAHVRKSSPQAIAGGYTEKYACLRALQEFMWGNVLPAQQSVS